MATDVLVSKLLDERAQKVQVIENLANTAADEGRDLYQTDLETIDNCRARIKAIDVQVEKVAGDLELADSVRSRVKLLDGDFSQRDNPYSTAGQYLWDGLHRHENADAQARWTRFHRRAAEHMGYDKGNTIPVAGGFNGLIVDPVVGAVLNPRPTGRPLFSALGVQPIESGSFLRPRIVDPNFESGVGEQGQEKSELPSKAWDIVSEPVQAKVIGGYINVSQLLIEMISSGLDMVVAQMNRRLEWYSEKAAVTEMDKTTEELALANTATSADVSAVIGEAASIVYANTGELPTWVAMGPKGWGRFIGLTDLAGRPLIPAVGPVNALGGGGSPTEFFTGLAGMRVVVTPAITDSDFYVGNPFGLEVYEKKLPVMQAVEPSVFGRQISVQTMLAFYRPVTSEAGPGDTPPAENNGVVRVEWATV